MNTSEHIEKGRRASYDIITAPHRSEVARLMQQITEEYEATKRGLSGIAITATHEFITARMENIGRCHDELKQLLGESDATVLLVESLEGAKL